MNALYTTIMKAHYVTIKIRIANRSKDKNESLIRTYQSKVGKRSLIFDPTVSLTIEPAYSDYTQSQQLRVIMPIHMIYQFGGVLSAIYQNLNHDDWYIKDSDGNVITITEKIKEYSKKIALPYGMVVLSPTIVKYEDRSNQYGITINIPGGTIGTMSYLEIAALINTIDHMDISTYTMMAGVSDQVAHVEQKIDMVLSMLNQRSGNYEAYRKEIKSNDIANGDDQRETIFGRGQTVGSSHTGEGTSGISEGSGLSLQLPIDEIFASLPGHSGSMG